MDVLKILETSSGVMDFFTPDINVALLRDAATYKELEAGALEVQVEQQANLMREDFMKRVGSYEAGAARRGVKVGEGSVQQNIEASAGALGEDIQTARKNVKLRGKQLKSSAKRLRTGAGNYEALGYTKKFVQEFGIQEK